MDRLGRDHVFAQRTDAFNVARDRRVDLAGGGQASAGRSGQVSA